MAQDNPPPSPQESTFLSEDGLKLREWRWRPEGKAKAIIVVMHGLGEHSGRYRLVIDYLVRRGYAVAAFDLRGHGLSEGPLCYVDSFDEYVADLHLFLQRACAMDERVHVFLLGHSQGGTIALLYALAHEPQLAGLILSAPVVKLSDDISPLLQSISGFLGSLLPKLPTIRVNSSALSRDLSVCRQYDGDPLVYHGGVPARMGAELVRATRRIQKQIGAFCTPMLILHGCADRLSDPQGSRDLYARASAQDKTLKLYDGLYHEVLNEPEKEQVLADLVSWLDDHA